MKVEAFRAVGVRRSKLGCGTALLTGVIVFLVVSLLSALVFAMSPDNGKVAASFIHAQPGSIPWDGQEPVTVLLMGGDGGSGQSLNTDSMIVASFDPRSRSLDLLSIPSTLWVTIPGYGPGTVSQAYGDGGARLALLTVESVVHVPIPYYAFVDAAAFRKLVDAVGGLTLNVRSPLRMTSSASAASRITAGTHRMDGKTALDYTRVREQTAFGYVDQMRRQQQVLLAFKDQILSVRTIFKIPTIVNTLGGSVPTNFPYDRIPVLVQKLLSVPAARIQKLVLDRSNGAVVSYSGSGTQVLLPNWQRIPELAAFLPARALLTGASVHVSNGGGTPGQAALLAGWLRQAGIQVNGYDTAPSSTIPNTEVILSPAATPGTKRFAVAVATILQVRVVTDTVSKKAGSVVVLIGRDFQDPTQQ